MCFYEPKVRKRRGALSSLLSSFLFGEENAIVAPKASPNDGGISLLLFVNDLPDALEALTLLFTHDVKMVTLRTQNLNLHSRLIAVRDWSHRSILTIGREVRLRLSF